LGEGMVDLLSTGLEGAGDLRSVDPRAVLRLAREGGLEDPERARHAAGRRRRFVLAAVRVGGRLRATAALYDAGAMAQRGDTRPRVSLFELGTDRRGSSSRRSSTPPVRPERPPRR
jgi:hypothetical protein